MTAKVTLSWTKLLHLGSMLTLLSACSFIAEPPPGSANELRVTREGRRCGRSIWYPLADTASTIAGVTWVVRANDDLSAAEHGAGGNTDLFRAERIAGYTVIRLFGASAIYGYVVEARCSALRHAAAPPAPPPEPARTGFPDAVAGFAFRMSSPQAAQLCTSKGHVWTLDGATGVCETRPQSSVNPAMHVTFELGVVSEIRTVYAVPADSLNRNYSALFSALRGSYGAPQVEPAPLSAACAQSLSQCLAAGERPPGPVWHWPKGTIELHSFWKTDRAMLEIRYTREDAQ